MVERLADIEARIANLGDLQDIPPIGEVMHGDVDLFEGFERPGKNAVEKHHEGMLDLCPRLAKRLAKIHLAGTVRG